MLWEWGSLIKSKSKLIILVPGHYYSLCSNKELLSFALSVLWSNSETIEQTLGRSILDLETC